ncbi:MAG: four helix bundle protein [Dehalococcoidia bacterium]
MTGIAKFEDINAWQKARDIVTIIYSVTNKGNFAKDYNLRDQIRRASISIMSNIAEGYGRQTDKEFTQFLYMARGSAAEVQSQLYVALDLGYLSKPAFQELYDLAEETMKLVSGFIKYLKSGAKSRVSQKSEALSRESREVGD